jgi:hypothetical protein
MGWAGNVAQNWTKRNAYKMLMGKPERKRPLRRPKRKQVDNFKMGLTEIEWGVIDWVDLAHDRDKWWALVNT